ncbi:capping protein inhibiting regulator of actin dynamics-like [Corticium candelabrum]|uniref:capping protein inhibiting regulator of actin dynamics-like n=1 Tax=Corticium candelabrum TaxID=121492 RepID=UPI002E265FA3|nr:capping protein inhibiting regulator of actin dynamics-like [Corticium candelabrum]
MSDSRTLQERQLALLLDIERLVLGETPISRSLDIPFFPPHPPRNKAKTRRATRRQYTRTAKVAEQNESNELLRDTPTHVDGCVARKAATDHLLCLNSEPRIVEWLMKKEKGIREVKRERRREERRRKLEAEEEEKTKEERIRLAEERYVEWSVKKLGEIREMKERKSEMQRSKSSCDAVLDNNRAFDDWLLQKRKKKEQKESKTSDKLTKASVSDEEKRKQYTEWFNRKKRLDRMKAKQKAQEEEMMRKHEEEEKKRKEEEKARRLSYDDWLKRKREKDEEEARQRKLDIEKGEHVDELNQYSDIARDLRLKRRMEHQMTRQRVHTGLTRPREERRLKQTKDATEFLKEYVEQIQLSEINSDGPKPNVKVAWSDLGRRPEPQGCETLTPMLVTRLNKPDLSLVPISTQSNDSVSTIDDVSAVTVTGEKNRCLEQNGKDVTSQLISISGDADPMASVV